MDTEIILIIVALLATVWIIKSVIPNSKNKPRNTAKTPKATKPTEKVDNDKVVVVKNVEENELKQAIQKFCDLYNKDEYLALPRMTTISDNEFVITFPHDIDFETFCYFVNYINYPEGIFYKADIKAWATTKQGDIWMTDDIINKKVMLYVPKDDKEYDNVYLTTPDNIGYKMGFAVGHTSRRLDSPKTMYQEPSDTVHKLKEQESLEFE